jgi:hypothetical protein
MRGTTKTFAWLLRWVLSLHVTGGQINGKGKPLV